FVREPARRALWSLAGPSFLERRSPLVVCTASPERYDSGRALVGPFLEAFTLLRGKLRRLLQLGLEFGAGFLFVLKSCIGRGAQPVEFRRRDREFDVRRGARVVETAPRHT